MASSAGEFKSVVSKTSELLYRLGETLHIGGVDYLNLRKVAGELSLELCKTGAACTSDNDLEITALMTEPESAVGDASYKEQFVNLLKLSVKFSQLSVAEHKSSSFSPSQISPLVDILDNARVSCEEKKLVADLFANLAYGQDGREALFCAGVVPALVGLLKQGDQEVFKSAVSAILALISTHKVKQAVIAAGGDAALKLHGMMDDSNVSLALGRLADTTTPFRTTATAVAPASSAEQKFG